MSQLEPYLPDADIAPILQKAYRKYPQFIGWNTDFVTTRIAPPWHGQLPDGTTRTTKYPVLQFVVVSDHPRPIQRGMGVRHATVACVWQNAFEQALKDEGHYVVGGKSGPIESIFSGVAFKHVEEMTSLSSIINDAVADPSAPKTALDAL